jgi:hypothetical protein
MSAAAAPAAVVVISNSSGSQQQQQWDMRSHETIADGLNPKIDDPK